MSAATAGPQTGRDETRLERIDRNLSELNGELRVIVTGVQVLFAFLLVVPFDTGFAHVRPFVRDAYLVTLALAGLAAGCTIAPAANHRLLFRHADKPHIVEIANHIAIVGVGLLGLAMSGCLLVSAAALFGTVAGVVAAAAGAAVYGGLWFAMPLARARQLPASAGSAAGAAARTGEVPAIDWAGAEVTAGTLEVELTAAPTRSWRRRFRDTCTHRDRPAGDWGAIALRGRRIRVTDVREGAEERLRQLLDGAVFDVAGVPPQAAAAQRERDRRMTAAFRDPGAAP
jgi:hypothetical protein